jgi:ATP-binding cassette subfamily B protein
MLAHFAHLYYFELSELETEAVDAELIALANESAGMEQLENPEFADAVALAREDAAQIQPSLEAVLQLAGVVLQIAATTFLLVALAPWLMVLPMLALLPILAGRRAQRHVTRARESVADQLRLNRHLLAVGTSPSHVHEIRLSRMGPYVIHRHGRGWDRVSRSLWRGEMASAILRGSAQLLFAVGFGAALALIVWEARSERASAGDVVLVLVLALLVGTQLANALNLMVRVYSTGTMVQRLEKLRRLAARIPNPGDGDATIPDLVQDGIRLDDVTFSYPGTAAPALRNVTLDLPAGATVALVGENGAGKSTLAKLICGLYEPTSGRVTVDGVELRGSQASLWRARVSPMFQDFAQIEMFLRETIGVGDTARITDDEALTQAAAQAQATPVVATVAGGLDGVVGVRYADGTQLSGGQWQRVGLSRCFMREAPLLVVLDEPAAALDAAAEYELFDRYAELSGPARHERGTVSVYISHRFASVRMADIIVVLRHVLQSGFEM